MTHTKILEVQLDLDGLFADFNGRVKLITGKEPHELERRHLWKAVNYDKEFFAKLEVIPRSMELWEVVKTYPVVKFLTGAPSVPAFRDQKREWVARIFGPQYEVNVVPRRDKQLYSGPFKVLIDDNLENIESWISKGGHGIFHDGDFDATINAFIEYDRALL